MSRKSISLSNRALFYQSREEQKHKDSQSTKESRTELDLCSVRLGDLYKQETTNKSKSFPCEVLTKPKVLFLREALPFVRGQTPPNTNKGNTLTGPGVTSLLQPQPKVGSTGFENVSSAQPKSDQHNLSYLKLSPLKELSVQVLERLGFTFLPFAFIFGTTFLFTALAITLQKQDGSFRASRSSKVPGLIESKVKVSQRSSWVFLESVLSHYINRDNSLLVSTPSLLQDAPYSNSNSDSDFNSNYPLELEKEKHQHRLFKARIVELSKGITLSKAKAEVLYRQNQRFEIKRVANKGLVSGSLTFLKKPTLRVPAPAPIRGRGYLELKRKLHFEFGTVREIQLSPLWNQDIKKDFLGVFPRQVRQANEKTLIRPWYRIPASHPPTRVILPTWEGSEGKNHKTEPLKPQLREGDLLFTTRAKHEYAKLELAPFNKYNNINVPSVGVEEQLQRQQKQSAHVKASVKNWEYYLPFYTSTERLLLEDDSIPSKKDSVYSKVLHGDTRSSHALTVMRKSFYDYGFSIEDSMESYHVIPNIVNLKKKKLFAISASRPDKNANFSRARLKTGESLTQASFTSEGLAEVHEAQLRGLRQSASSRKSSRVLKRPKPKFELCSTNPLSSSSALNTPLNISEPADQSALLLSNHVLPKSKVQVSKGTLGFANRALLSKANPLPLRLRLRHSDFHRYPLFGDGKSATPKKNFWEYTHSISGYHFPELQDHEVAELFGEVAKRSKVEVVDLVQSGTQSEGGESTVTLFKRANPHFCLDTNQVLLTPYLAEVPPKIITSACNKTEVVQNPSAPSLRDLGCVRRSAKQVTREREPFDRGISNAKRPSTLRVELSRSETERNKSGGPSFRFATWVEGGEGPGFRDAFNFNAKRVLVLTEPALEKQIPLFNSSSAHQVPTLFKKGKQVEVNRVQRTKSAGLCFSSRGLEKPSPYLLGQRLSPYFLDQRLSALKDQRLSPRSYPSPLLKKGGDELREGLDLSDRGSLTSKAGLNHLTSTSRWGQRTPLYSQILTRADKSKLELPLKDAPFSGSASDSESEYTLTSLVKVGLPATFMGSTWDLNLQGSRHNEFSWFTPALTSLPSTSSIQVRKLQAKPLQLQVGTSKARVFERFAFEEGFKTRYTLLKVKKENKLRKGFQELGRDYDDYLKQPKDSLQALFISTSLEQDEQIKEEKRERAAERAGTPYVKPVHDKDKDNPRREARDDSEPRQNEFNTIDPLDLSDSETQDDLIIPEPLDDDEMDELDFYVLREVRDMEDKFEERKDSQGLVLSLTSPSLSGKRHRTQSQLRDKTVALSKASFTSQAKCVNLRFRLITTNSRFVRSRYNSFLGVSRLKERVPGSSGSRAREARVVGGARQKGAPLLRLLPSKTKPDSNSNFYKDSPSRYPSLRDPLKVKAPGLAPLDRLRRKLKKETLASHASRRDPSLGSRREASVGASRASDAFNFKAGVVQLSNAELTPSTSTSTSTSTPTSTSTSTSTMVRTNASRERRALLKVRGGGRRVLNPHFGFVHQYIVSDRKHTFFGDKSLRPGQFFAQEERLLCAHVVNPYIRYDQSNPWPIPEQWGALAVTDQNSGTSSGYTDPVHFDQLENLKNLQTQARLGRFVDSPTLDPATDSAVLTSRTRELEQDQSRGLVSEAKRWKLELASRTGTSGTHSRIDQPDLDFRVIAEDEYEHEDEEALPLFFDLLHGARRIEPGPFRLSRPSRKVTHHHISLPPLSESEWHKSIEWQLKRHFLAEDIRLKEVRAEEPYENKRFKVKRVERFLPWLLMEKPSFHSTTISNTISHDQTLNLNTTHDQSISHALTGSPASRARKARVRGSDRLREAWFGVNHEQIAEHLDYNSNSWSTIERPGITHALYKNNNLPVISLDSIESIQGSPKETVSPLLKYSIDQGSNLLYSRSSKDRSTVDFNHFIDLTKRILPVQDEISTELIFEPVSTCSWLLIYRLFLALILKQVFKSIYQIIFKDSLIRLMNSSYGHTITSPGFREAVEGNAFPESYKPKTRLKDISGIKNALLPLSEIIWFFRNGCKSRNGPRGVILIAPNGVNTAALAQAVAGEAEVPIIVHSLRALTLTRRHPQKRLEKVLRLARAQSPCVLFLDELDLIGQAREGVIRDTISGGGKDSLISLDSSQLDAAEGQDRELSLSPLDQDTFRDQERRIDIMLRLLTVIDDSQYLNGVVIITTSRNSATLDPALLRPGRFDRLIHLTRPNHESRVELFKSRTRQLGHTPKMPWEYFSVQTANMDGAYIVSAINYSLLRAIVNDTVHTVETLEYGLNCVRALKEKRGKTRSSPR